MHKELFVIIFIFFSSVRWYGSGGFTSDERSTSVVHRTRRCLHSTRGHCPYYNEPII